MVDDNLTVCLCFIISKVKKNNFYPHFEKRGFYKEMLRTWKCVTQTTLRKDFVSVDSLQSSASSGFDPSTESQLAQAHVFPRQDIAND